MKKIIAGVLSVTLMCGSLALPASESGITLFDTTITADAETYGDYEYVILDDGTVEISRLPSTTHLKASNPKSQISQGSLDNIHH